MPSSQPGFEYDIFVSYRHNDNRSAWVTDFVAALREELAATLKNPVEIYFDKNSHDGLQDTHDVDKSLEGKLKCLIFIPIISQTYCDEKSFAWQHEFRAFNRLAKEDQFGRDIKLNNGNVTSRILAVKIHDLDESDRIIIEKEIGGVLRPVEFIYKSQGVNRPLRLAEEQPGENLNHTTYRNQINKLANAIKETLGALTSAGDPKPNAVTKEAVPIMRKGGSTMRRFAKPVGLSVLLLTVMSVLLYFLLGPRKVLGSESKYPYDVAVMYLENFTDNAKYGDQLASLVHINLTGDTSLHVMPRQKLFDEMKEATGEAVAPDRSHTTDIAKKIGTRTILTGSIHQQGEMVLVQLELTEVKTGKILKTEKLEGRMDQIFSLSDKICKNMMASSRQEFNVAVRTTGSYEAYGKFHSGLEDLYAFKFRGASEKFKEAIVIDSTFALGYLMLAQTQEVFALMDVNVDLRIPVQLIEKAQKYSYKLSSRDRNMVEVYSKIYSGDFETAQKLAVQNYDSSSDDRLNFLPVIWSGFVKGGPAFKTACEKYLKRNPSDGVVNNQMAYYYAVLGDELQTEKYIKRYTTVEPNTSNAFDSGFETSLLLGKQDAALKYLEQWEQLEGSLPYRKKSRYFLALAKAKELKDYYHRYTDSVPYVRSFQEMLPFALALEGRFNLAATEFDKIISRFEKKGNKQDALMMRLHKGILFAAAHRYDEALAVFDENIKSSSEKLKDGFNPYPFLANYYAGLTEIRRGNTAQSRLRLGALGDLLRQPMYDWRFGELAKLLEAEILLYEKNYAQVKSIQDKLYFSTATFSVGALTVSYSLAWKTGDYAQALKQVEPFYKNFLRSATWQGGDPAHFALERIFSDYTTARIHEDAGNKKEAIRYYNAFLEQMKGSDEGIKEKEDARDRLKRLGER